MQRNDIKLEKMKTTLLSLLFLLMTLFSFGQDALSTPESAIQNTSEVAYYVPERMRVYPRRNSIYAELGGSGGFGSLNYEWNFRAREYNRWMLRTGISGTHIDKNNGSALIFPVMLHFVRGQKHALDVGIGQTLTVTTRGSAFVRMPISLGYRLEPEGSRMFYRFSYTPIVSYLVDFQWEHWAGISIGFKLNTTPKL